MKKYKLVIITVTYNPNVKELNLFIDSYHKYNDLGDKAKLIIVDNSPSNSWGRTEFAQRHDDIEFISNPSNPGFGASNNIGFKKYPSEYVLFINNDVEFLEPLFASLIKEFEKDTLLGCIGIHQKGGAPSFFPKMTAPPNIRLDKFDQKTHFISGAFMFFKSCIFVEIGMFDPQLFMYFEEFDLSERLLSKGYKTIYLDKYQFLHKAGHRTKQNEFASQKGSDSFCYICKKYQLDYKQKNQAYIKRMRKMIIYNLFILNIKEVFKLRRIINYRKKVIKENF
ncbi:glycosyltransferase [Phocaeicola sp.]